MVVALQLSEEAAKPVTTVRDCVSTFASAKPQDIIKESVGQFYGIFVVEKKIFFKNGCS